MNTVQHIEADPVIFQATAIAIALRLYAKHRIKVNRAYTPQAMLRMAGRITGKTFARGEYLAASEALERFRDRRLNAIKEGAVQ